MPKVFTKISVYFLQKLKHGTPKLRNNEGILLFHQRQTNVLLKLFWLVLIPTIRERMFYTKINAYSSTINLQSSNVKKTFLSAKMCSLQLLNITHCAKSVRIRSFSGPYFPVFGLNTVRYSVFTQ